MQHLKLELGHLLVHCIKLFECVIGDLGDLTVYLVYCNFEKLFRLLKPSRHVGLNRALSLLDLS